VAVVGREMYRFIARLGFVVCLGGLGWYFWIGQGYILSTRPLFDSKSPRLGFNEGVGARRSDEGKKGWGSIFVQDGMDGLDSGIGT
jgi:hypothetical protein